MRNCIDCGASLAHRGHRAVRCRPCRLEADTARRLRFYHVHKLCRFDIGPCSACGALMVKRRGNAILCGPNQNDCRGFFRREQMAEASRRYYARHKKRPLRRAA